MGATRPFQAWQPGWGLSAVLISLLLLMSPRQVLAVSPNHHWMSLHGGFFVVIYHEGETRMAARALKIAKQAAARFDTRFGWHPTSPVYIVLTDHIESSNGLTTVVPRNVIHIYPTPPTPTDTLQRFDDWLRVVISYEYTHVIQLGMAHGTPRALRAVFGRNPLLFPGQFQPRLLQEGLSVFEEGRPALGIGRLSSPMFSMEMRAEVHSGLKPWDKVAMDGVTQWPAGNIPFLYGSYFYQFLSHRYGKKVLPKLVRNYSRDLIPFRVSDNLYATTGKTRKQLWGQFTQWLKRHDGTPPYPPHAKVTHGKRLTHFGFDTQSVRAAPDGRVFFVRDDHRRHPALMEWRPGHGSHEIAPLFAPARIDYNAQAGILVARPEICHEYNLYFDLYQIAPSSGAVTRLTHCGRYRDATWSPSGRAIAAVRVKLGISSLVLLTAHGTHPRTLWTGTHGEVLDGIDWSPQGDRLVAAMWRPVRGWALEQFDLTSRRWTTLSAAAGAVADPQYTADGKAVLFSSSAGGVYNLRRLNLASGDVATLTHVSTGAFSPSQAEVGDPIYYLGYTSHGYDLFRLSPSQELAIPLAARQRAKLPPPASAPSAIPKGHPYHPWHTLAPNYWMPELTAGPSYVEIGALTTGSDALGLDSYSADVNYEPVHHLFGGSLFYQYADRFTAGVERRFEFDTNGQSLARIRRQDLAQAVYSRPFPSLEETVTPMAGIALDHEKDVVERTASARPYSETVAGLALRWNTTQRWPISISRDDGQDLLLVAETSRPFGSDFSGNAFRLDWHGYFSLGGERVLMLRYLEGYATSGARPFNLGGALSPGAATPAQGLVFNRRDFPLRGYPSGLPALTGQRLREATIELRLPLIRPERAWSVVPIGLHQMSLRTFVQTGASWSGGGQPPSYYKSAGLEVVFSLNFFYQFNARLRLGVAHGFSAIGTNQTYLRLSLPLSP